MKAGQLCRVAVLLPLLAGGGCATKALWDGRMEACNEPAQETRLRLFNDEQRKDLLVVYTEYSERKDSTRTRAFLLHRNEDRLTEKLPPRFERAKLTTDLQEVPMFAETNAIGLPKTLCAVVSTNGQEFTLYSGGRASGSYELLTYNDGKGRWLRVALTPAAVAADATVVGGCVFLWAWSQGGLNDIH